VSTTGTQQPDSAVFTAKMAQFAADSASKTETAPKRKPKANKKGREEEYREFYDHVVLR
jgi:hypothetical protein